ncbi:dual specificity protein kinase splA isoform X2 [Poeciliopsis prolifica]|uniref:dual specificity protein kinase splA isoform X2 n=1 Tax=Poeciliopsis prolifica TaxID=188132 RepID=UPI0024130C8D|nr:dual specificity protein kinase splA isoform X2 [Poeciliopsis prolifica]
MKGWLSTGLSLAVLLSAKVLAQTPVPINFIPALVQVQTGSDILFTVQFQGRLVFSATQLRIRAAQLNDAGFYTVDVVPASSTGFVKNSRSVELKVFDPVAGISLTVPSVAVEEKNVSLSCTWTGGTKVTAQWQKDGTAITPDSRITISSGFLVINPARRDDAGEYSCTASNNVSAQTSTKSLTVYYGPNTPVLTVDSPKKCVGGGDVLVGQAVRLTCTSTSLPSATFSWERDGQPISSGAPDSGVLSLQTFSTKESGQYACIATNSITRGTSKQSYNLTVVGVCFDGGEVAGIVIGAFLGLLIIVLLILFLVVLVRRKRAQAQRSNVVFDPETDPIGRPLPPDPQTNGVWNLDQGLQPPLHQTNRQANQPEHLITNNLETQASPQARTLNRERDFDVQQNNSRTRTNQRRQNLTSYPNDGFDNPAFTHMDSQNVSLAPSMQQQQNPNILIQAVPGQGGRQPPAVQVSLNSNNPNNNAHIPTINVNLNSYPGNGQQALQESSSPPSNQGFNGVPQTRNNFRDTRWLNAATQGGQFYPSNHRLNGHVNQNYQDEAGLIPTGYTHFNNNMTSQLNENTQTYQQEPEPHRRPDRESRQHESTPRSRQRQIPWDFLRGTPAYPNGTPQRVQMQPEADSDYSAEYTVHPPIREGRTVNRLPPQSQADTRRRTPPRRDPPSEDSQTYHAADRPQNANNDMLPEHSHHTQRNPRAERERSQRDIRGSQTAPRQETTRSNNPQASPLMSQQASAGNAVMSQEPTAQQGLTTPQGTDTRALADPNHLHQPHTAQQNIVAPAQTRRGQTQPVMHGAIQPRQRGADPVPVPPAQHNSSNLTQAAVRAHTERAQVFKNRREQTQTALIHSGTVQTPAPAAGGQQPPPPPPPIPLEQFQALPKTHTQHKSPTRVPQPLRQNMPATQRQHGASRHTTMMPRNHHHHPGHAQAGAHRHGHVHTHNHRHPANAAAWQQQAHRGRPR